MSGRQASIADYSLAETRQGIQWSHQSGVTLEGETLQLIVSWRARKRETLIKRSDAVQDPLAQQGKPGLAVHHPFDELHSGHMAFCLTVIDLQS